MKVTLLVAGAIAGCTDPAYEVRITATDQEAARCDTSCVRSAFVALWADDRAIDHCIPNLSMASIRDHRALAGKLEVPAPDGLRGITVTALRGTDCSDLAISTGTAAISDDTVDVPMECSVSCRNTAGSAVRTTNVFSVMAGACEYGRETSVAAGAIRPTDLTRVAAFEPTSSFSGAPTSALTTGAGYLADFVPAATSPRACAAVMAFENRIPLSASCVTGARGLCSLPGEIEIATLNGSPLESIRDGYSVISVFAELDPTTRAPAPIAGATVTVDPGGPPVRITYTDLVAGDAGQELRPRAEQRTGISGSFVVESPVPVWVTVATPAKRSRRMIGGGTIFTDGNRYDTYGAAIFTPD